MRRASTVLRHIPDGAIIIVLAAALSMVFSECGGPGSPGNTPQQAKGLTITSVLPNTGSVTGGTSVRILGSGFESGASVKFGDIGAASVTVVSPSQIQAVTPGSMAGAVSVTVTNPDLQSGTLAEAFDFLHTVTLSWRATTAYVAGYNVYRSSTSTGPYTRLNHSLVKGTTFTDDSVQPGETIFYVATAVGAGNLESSYSNQVRVSVPSP